MPYRAPLSDLRFILDKVVDFAGVAATERFAAASPDMTQAILAEAARLCENDLAPLNRSGDQHPARLENGAVRTSPGFAEGYRAIAAGGWIGMSSSPDYGGMGLPITLASCVNEMMGSACLALQLNPLMTQGQIEALEHHAPDAIKALYLPRLISGEWCGTMNLTEPQAGSDVGALRTRAEPNGDGSYAITGQKIFISWGDNDFTGNVCHLVLARLPGGGEGTRGISLFMVPKVLPNPDGSLGNDVMDGGSGSDVLHGGSGDDILNGRETDFQTRDYLNGGAGNDVLLGGDGDNLNGGTGADIFALLSRSTTEVDIDDMTEEDVIVIGYEGTLPELTTMTDDGGLHLLADGTSIAYLHGITNLDMSLVQLVAL